MERWWIVVDVEEQEDGLDYEYLVKVWRGAGLCGMYRCTVWRIHVKADYCKMR